MAEGIAVLAKANLPQINLDTFMARVKGAQYSSINGQERPGGSLLQSKERGSSSEVEYLNGYISRLGAQLGVKTPWNDQLLAQPREHTVIS
ncbi:MAG: hypothetical protein JKY56_17620 [Kofleriaceae bacterium]|nr:hypothetical protein [Kofleriaceae bacterium]